MYKTAIFDLDGTLLDTLDDLRDAVNTALSAHGYPPRTREEICRFVGKGIRSLISLSVSLFLAFDEYISFSPT